MAKHIVIETSGKDCEVFGATIKIFTAKKEAQEYCNLKTKRDREDERYWTKAEILKENEEYSFN
jgi:hypothetical protein